MNTSLKERDGWWDYLVENKGRRLYGTCSDMETALNSIEKAEKTLKTNPINPRRNP